MKYFVQVHVHVPDGDLYLEESRSSTYHNKQKKNKPQRSPSVPTPDRYFITLPWCQHSTLVITLHFTYLLKQSSLLVTPSNFSQHSTAGPCRTDAPLLSVCLGDRVHLP